MPKDKYIMRKSTGQNPKIYVSDQGQNVNTEELDFQQTRVSAPHFNYHTLDNGIENSNIIPISSVRNKNKKQYLSFPDYIRYNLKQAKDQVARQIPQKYKQQIESIYQHDYDEKQCKIQKQNINRINLREFKPEGNFKTYSTYQRDFTNSKPQTQVGTRIRKNSLTKLNDPPITFAGISTYNQQFIQWGKGDTVALIPNNHPTVMKEMPFLGKSSYKETFQGNPCIPVKSFKGAYIQRSPLNPPQMPQQVETSNRYSFKPFQVVQTQTQSIRPQTSLNPSYKGQYKTTYNKDFTNKLEEEININKRYGVTYEIND